MPVGIHDCTLSEIEATYANNHKRRQVWEGFGKFLEHLKGLSGLNAIYVDGGFVTDKEHPKDVDIVIEYADSSTKIDLAATYWFFRQRDKVWDRYSVDVWDCVENEPPPTMVNFFQFLSVQDAVERGVPLDTQKGILRVSLR